MGAHNGAIDHRVFIVGIGSQMLKDPLPDAGFRPTAEPGVYLLPITEALRQVAPWNAGTITIEHCLDEQPVIPRRYSNVPVTSGQQFLDPVPLVVAKGIAAHRSAPKADPLGIEERAAPESPISTHGMIVVGCCNTDSPLTPMVA
jgi:hypothetical protein